VTITYPLSFPASLYPTSMMLTPSDAVARAASPFTYQEQVQRHQGQQWLLTLEYSNVNAVLLDNFAAFLMRLKGPYGTFLFNDPTKTSPRGIGTGAPLVDGSAQSGDYLNTKGWTPGTTGIMKAGDYIQLGSSGTARLYRLTADANSDSSGKASLEIWPQIRQYPAAPSDNDAIVVSSPSGRFRLDKSTGWKIKPPVLGSIQITAHEAL